MFIHVLSTYLANLGKRTREKSSSLRQSAASYLRENEWVVPLFLALKGKNPPELCFGCRIPSPTPWCAPHPQPALRKVLEEISSHNWAFGCCCIPRMSLPPPAVCLTERHKSRSIFLYNFAKVFPLMASMVGPPEVPCGWHQVVNIHVANTLSALSKH